MVAQRKHNLATGKDTIQRTEPPHRSGSTSFLSDKNRHACANLNSALRRLEKLDVLLLVPDLMILFLAGYQLMGIGLAARCLRDFLSSLTAMGDGMTLEALIAAGVFGWLVIGMVMMGLGIW